MAVGSFEAGNRRTRHQEVLEDSLIDHTDSLSSNAVIIEFVKAIEVHAVESLGRGIVNDRDEVRQYRLIDVLCEGLPFAFTLLTVAFDTVTKDLMKENAAGPARQDGWTR